MIVPLGAVLLGGLGKGRPWFFPNALFSSSLAADTRCPMRVRSTLPHMTSMRNVAHLLAVVGPGPDESCEFRVANDPVSSLVRGWEGIVVYEVLGILEAVDGEQSCCGESMAGCGTAYEAVHHVDEDMGDVDAVVCVFEDVF